MTSEYRGIKQEIHLFFENGNGIRDIYIKYIDIKNIPKAIN